MVQVYWELTRSRKGLIASAATLCSFALVGESAFGAEAFAAAFAVWALSGAGFSLNDVLDLPRDRINSPERPLPSGRIRPAAATMLSAGLFSAGLLVSYWLGVAVFLLSLGVTVSLLLYSRLKTLPQVGGVLANILTAILCSTPFVYGAAEAGAVGASVWPSALAFLTILGRELLKDVLDFEGDREVGLATLPTLVGIRPSVYAAVFMNVLVITLSPVPVMIGHFGLAYALIFGVVDVLLVLYIVSLIARPTMLSVRRFANASALLFSLAVVAFYVGVQ